MESFDAIVLGAGPGGYVCAIKLGQLGVKTAIVEKGNLGGVCLNEGCIPSKALIHIAKQYDFVTNKAENLGINIGKVNYDHSKGVSFKDKVVKKLTGGVGALLKANKVTVIKGFGKIESKNTLEVDGKFYSFKNLVLSTGSDIIEIPPLPYSDKRVLNSRTALELKEVPKKLVVVGAGYIGLELGMTFANLGSKVTVVEALEGFLPGFDKDIQIPLKQRMRKLGMELHLGAMAKSLDKKGLKVALKDGKEQVFDADYFLCCVGRKPLTKDIGLEKVGIMPVKGGFLEVDNQQRTKVPNIFAIGDIVANRPMLAHKASYEGEVAAEVIHGKKVSYDTKCVPAVMFTDPEVAQAGDYDEKEEVTTAKFPFAAIGKAIASDHTEGFVKWIMRKKDNRVLRCTIIGSAASDLISEAALAIEMGSFMEDIALTIHPHPTMGESLMEGAKLTLGEPIHTILRKR